MEASWYLGITSPSSSPNKLEEIFFHGPTTIFMLLVRELLTLVLRAILSIRFLVLISSRFRLFSAFSPLLVPSYVLFSPIL